MKKRLVAPALAILLVAGPLLAADFRVEPLKEAPPASELSAAVVAQLMPEGFKVMQGEKRTRCEVWLAKQWDAKADFKPSETVLDPLAIGTLVGAIRFPRKAEDFRGQDIPAGVYTLRYANQPVDGNHVGTFETRDFLLMLPASADQSPKPIAEADLFKASAQSAGSSHPAIMPLVKAEGDEKLPAMRHLEAQDWWTVQFAGKSSKGAKIVLELIVVGKAAE
jgi:hypothetical protein